MDPAAAIQQLEQQLAALGYTVSQQPASRTAPLNAMHTTLSLLTWERSASATIGGDAFNQLTLNLRILIPPVRQMGASAARAAIAAAHPLFTLRPEGEQHELYLSGVEAAPLGESTGSIDCEITLSFYE